MLVSDEPICRLLGWHGCLSRLIRPFNMIHAVDVGGSDGVQVNHDERAEFVSPLLMGMRDKSVIAAAFNGRRVIRKYVHLFARSASRYNNISLSGALERALVRSP